MKSQYSLLIIASLIFLFACSNEPDDNPLTEKKAQVEITISGSLNQYTVNFGMHSLTRGVSTPVGAQIIQPADLDWTQTVPDANTFSLTAPATISTLTVESNEPVHTFGFGFNATFTGDGSSTEDLEPITATITVRGDNLDFQSFTYQAKLHLSGKASWRGCRGDE